MSFLASSVLCFALFLVRVLASDEPPQDLWRRSGEQFARGVHWDRDPLDPAKGRGGLLFAYTYNGGHPYADQIASMIYSKGSNLNGTRDSTVITHVWDLQWQKNQSFSVDFLCRLDASLKPSLGVSGLSFLDKFTFGYTYSNEYKYERDQLTKGKMTILQYFYTYNYFQMNLDTSSFTLSAEFTADLGASANVSVKNQARALVAKYGSLYIKSALFGVSITQNEYVPRQIYTLWHNYGVDEQGMDDYFESGDTEAGRQLLAFTRNHTSQRFQRRTSLYHRGGLFPPLDISQLSHTLATLHQRPEMLQLSFAPLSDLISNNPSLKEEVALLVRSQLLVSVGLNFLDSGLFFPIRRRGRSPSVSDAQDIFPGLVSYSQQIRTQMAQMIATNGSALADPSVSPFIKMDAVYKAITFADLMFTVQIGLTRPQVEKWYTLLIECNETPSKVIPNPPQFSAEKMKLIHEGLLKVVQVGSAFDKAWYDAFTVWSVENDKVKGLAKYTEKICQLDKAFGTVLEPLGDYDCPKMPGGGER